MEESRTYLCNKCGREHEGWPALAYTAPVFYDNLSEEERLEIGRDLSPSTINLINLKGPRSGPFKFNNPFTVLSVKIKTVQFHHLGPGSYKIIHKLFVRIGTAIYLGQGTQL